MGKWYYSFQALEFLEFWEETPDMSEIKMSNLKYNSDGPFSTFAKAKADALESFRSDKHMAHQSIKRIMLSKKPNSDRGGS